MMHCSVNSWRQLSSSQTFVESGERRKSLGEGCKCDIQESSMHGCKADVGSWSLLVCMAPAPLGAGPGTAGRVLWESRMSGFLIHHCSLLPVLHKEGFALGQVDMLISLHELLTHTLWPIPLHCVKGAHWQEIQAFFLAVTPINSARLSLTTLAGFGLELSRRTVTAY